MRDIDVVITTYNSMDVLPGLAEAIQGAVEIASLSIIDNGSSDGTLEVIAALDWGIVPIVKQMPHNPGFGVAMNAGVQVGEAPYVLILNPDVIIQPDALRRLREHLQSRHRLAAVGARLETGEGRPVSSARSFPTRRDIVMRRAREADLSRGYTEVDWICGAVMLWRREVFLALDGFDSSYFLYFEDMDLCHRAWSNGWVVGADGRIRVIHDQGHGKPTSEYLRSVSRSSRRFYARRWLGRTGSGSAMVADAIEYLGARRRSRRV